MEGSLDQVKLETCLNKQLRLMAALVALMSRFLSLIVGAGPDLDLVRDVRHDLHRLAEVLPLALLRDHRLVNLHTTVFGTQSRVTFRVNTREDTQEWKPRP